MVTSESLENEILVVIMPKFNENTTGLVSGDTSLEVLVYHLMHDTYKHHIQTLLIEFFEFIRKQSVESTIGPEIPRPLP